MQWLDSLMRSDLRALATYSSASHEAAGFVPSIEIDANENPWPPYGPISGLCNPNRYIDSQQPPALLERLGAAWGVSPDWLMIGRGSDEGVDMLTRLFCAAGQDQILICPPTFAMYEFSARLQGAEVLKVPLNAEGQLDVPAILAACTPKTKLIYIPSPHAPMGHMMTREDILALCQARREQTLIVVDEAYIGFTSDAAGMIPFQKDASNLVILRTLSKTHSLAGERIGGVIGRPELVDRLRKILAPYPLPQSAVRCGMDALSPNGMIQSAEYRRILVAERKRMAELLPQSPFVVKVYPSVTNFLLVEVKDSDATMKLLMKYGILARSRSGLIPNTVRLTVSKPEDNDVVLKVLGIEVPLANKGRMPRLFSAHRGTKETMIDVTVNLDAPNFLKVDTGMGFFDHMLAQIATHGGFGLELHCKGDLEVDQHHSIEDCALALGEALKAALGDKRGIARFGFTSPLDEALASVTVDLSGRPYCVFNASLPAPTIGEMSSEMVPHFFHSLAMALAASLHITAQGKNTHHIVESIFKATGRALRQAFRREGDEISSTKGML
ncbi:MAG: imidazoleglycerol-phosphate dehydratase HisB [Alphaproteobacteria bacterium]|nr:imidazoleglycerol-phosphate dehydratase HisB [Alphaproteobacteria bacterium]